MENYENRFTWLNQRDWLLQLSLFTDFDTLLVRDHNYRECMNASKIRPDLSKVHMHGQVSKDLVTIFPQVSLSLGWFESDD